MKPHTRLTRLGRPEPQPGAPSPVNASVERASTVLARTNAELYTPGPGGRTVYGRGGLEPQTSLRAALCDLYGADHAALTSSGLAAVILALLCAADGPGQAWITDAAYGPVRRFCDAELRRLGLTPRYYPAGGDGGLPQALGRGARLVALESPGSLTFEVQDVPAIAAAARAVGAASVIDDTWSAGLLMNPLDLGVDYAAQALTKYVGGHSDFLMGAVIARGPAAARLARMERVYGHHVGADDAFLALRGLRTLALRIERSAETSLILADRLAGHPRISRVIHPARPDHPDHRLYVRDFSGAAGCFAVVLKDADQAGADRVIDGLALFGRGFSWGGYESLAIAAGPQLRRTAAPFPEAAGLLRFSIGLEDPDDLWADLEHALSA